MKRERMFRSILIGVFIIMSGTTACQSPPPPTPPLRQFTTTDLLIDPSLLPEGWKAEFGPTEYTPNVLGFRKNLGGSAVDLRNTNASADHIVAIFSDSPDAERAYRDHNFNGNTKGRFSKTWHEIPGWNYVSPVANQFRIVCVERENLLKLGDSCVIEAQFEEFLSIVLYGNTAPDRTVSDLEMIARAVDERIAEFLGK